MGGAMRPTSEYCFQPTIRGLSRYITDAGRIAPICA